MAGTLIANVRLIDAEGERDGALRVEGERIAEWLPADLADDALSALAARHGCARVDGGGRWLIPGGVDPHLHFALPVAGTRTVDDFETGGRSALAGGTTSVIDFVTPGREEDLGDAISARREEAARCCCDHTLHPSLTAWRADSANQLAACAREHGLRSLKLYMAYLESIGLARPQLAAAMGAAAELDLVVMLHCEDGARVSAEQARLLAAGERGPAAHPRSRPAEFEVAAVRDALALAAAAGCRPYIVHVSAGESVAAVVAARAGGQVAYAETCPQYLLMDESLYAADFETAAAAVMSPPLRAATERDALNAALARGDFDVVATDHCAFDRAQKALGRDDFTRIPGGAAGVEHRLALLFTLAVAEGPLSPSDWVRLVSTRPAEIFGLHPRKGSLTPGADADLVLWDPRARRTLRAAADHHPCDHSLYEGMALRGAAARVWSRGETVFADGVLTAPAGRGRWLGA